MSVNCLNNLATFERGKSQGELEKCFPGTINLSIDTGVLCSRTSLNDCVTDVLLFILCQYTNLVTAACGMELLPLTKLPKGARRTNI